MLAHQRGADGGTAVEVLERFIGMWRSVVVTSGGTAGCVVAGVAVDTDAGDADVMALVRTTFRAWIALLTRQLAAAGVPAGRAGAVAATALASMEGALILCRAEGTVKPLDAVATEVLRLVRETP